MSRQTPATPAFFMGASSSGDSFVT
jgi:hypothetical protein